MGRCAEFISAPIDAKEDGCANLMQILKPGLLAFTYIEKRAPGRFWRRPGDSDDVLLQGFFGQHEEREHVQPVHR